MREGRGDRRERDAALGAAAETLTSGPSPAEPGERGQTPHFDRAGVLAAAAAELDLPAADAERALFADLKDEQRLIAFDDITPERLLHRYNVALAQAVLLRATSVAAEVRGEPPGRLRNLLRAVKFHRLMADVAQPLPGVVRLSLDGPLSLFSATQKYGLQLALFLPSLLRCRDFSLRAELRWGAQRQHKHLLLSPADGLHSEASDAGVHAPAELAMFAELFRKRVPDWDASDDVEPQPAGDGYWVPDFVLTERATGRRVYLEILGYWRKSAVERTLARLRAAGPGPFLLAVSGQYRTDEAGGDAWADEHVLTFKSVPAADEVARAAARLLG